MVVLQLLPAVIASLLLGAHFLRGGHQVAMAAFVALPGILLVAQPWAARLVQVGLLLGVLEWIRTAALLIQARLDGGQPFLRLALILGMVALLTGLSILGFRWTRVRNHFQLPPTR